jgi:spermidine/putrescine-binding protein
MKFLKLLIFLAILSFTSKAVVQDPRLIDAAKKEGGKVIIYGSPETPVVDAVIQAFQKKTGLSVDYWRASAMSVMNRAMSEYRAGNALYDVVLNNTDPLYIMAKEGMVAKYDSQPARYRRHRLQQELSSARECAQNTRRSGATKIPWHARDGRSDASCHDHPVAEQPAQDHGKGESGEVYY